VASTVDDETVRAAHASPPLAVSPRGRGGAADRRKRWLLGAIVVLGFGLIAAPAIFQMFDRAPAGGQMIDEFRPFMTKAEIEKLRGFLATIDAAAAESKEKVDPAAAQALGLDRAGYEQQLVYLTAFEREYAAIDADMTDMLDKMDANLDGFAGVDALPPFPLFPWFFVIPGVLIAGFGVVALVALRRGRSGRGALVALVVLGVGLLAAPFVFQMFSRAPGGGQMIDDFRSLMTREKVTTTQGYFVTIGVGEGELRTRAVPAAGLAPGAAPAVERFNREWPRINREMAPVVGVMADNVDNYEAVDALPPFPLFPWFFVIPGVLVAVLAGVALRHRDLDTKPVA
jgi:hypothetical protein